MVYRGGSARRDTFFRLQVYERVGISPVEVYKRVGKCVIRLKDEFYGFIKSRKRSIFVFDSYLNDSAFTAVKRDKVCKRGTICLASSAGVFLRSTNAIAHKSTMLKKVRREEETEGLLVVYHLHGQTIRFTVWVNGSQSSGLVNFIPESSLPFVQISSIY